MAGTVARKRDKRIEVRATAEERALIDRAVAETGTDLTDFVITTRVRSRPEGAC